MRLLINFLVNIINVKVKIEKMLNKVMFFKSLYKTMSISALIKLVK